MAQRLLEVGPCYCATGRQRYRVKPSVTIPWEAPGNIPLPPHVPTDPAPDSDHDSDHDPDSDLDPDVDMSDSNAPLPGQHDLIVQDSQESQDDQSSDDNTDGATIMTVPATLTDINSIQQIINNITNQQNQQALGVDFEIDTSDDSDALELGGDNNIDDDSDNEDDDEDDDGNDENSEPREDRVPELAPYRLNLTALSQRYNIYAAAYRTVIHISRVRSCVDHALPPRPDLILRPPVSQEALRVGGYLDHNRPHQMNHLIMSDLGDEEILLLACDDGDVVAYYTSQIERALLQYASSGGTNTPVIVKPFFHQNVGKSAWGLAVHKRSRLIAVGNNHHEVHVFAPALKSSKCTSPGSSTRMHYGRDLFLRIKIGPDGKFAEKPKAFDFETPNLAESFFFGRGYSYRLILETGDEGDNIPNVAFSSDADGVAVEVLAIDISGKLWILNIWPLFETPHWYVESLYKVHQQAVAARTPNRRIPFGIRGWGVLVLPESSFLPTDTFQESLGLSPAEAVYVNHDFGRYIGTSKALEHIKDNSTTHPWVRQTQTHRFRLGQFPLGDMTGEWYDPKVNCKEDWTANQDEAADKFPNQTPPTSHQRGETKGATYLFADGSSVMRTYEMDIELMGGDVDNIGIMFKNVLYQKKPARATMPRIPFSVERFANLLHVPELSLVVAGSMCGRVALVTLTRPLNPHFSFRRGFKVEAILPKRQDEDLHLRPICPLLGVAIGPIPLGGTDEGLARPAPWRTPLPHYAPLL
ncbi:hypothetical protein O1611_g1281 [Lasiodiplodia mahajangana]|uniref:Uncharacterized protein n=1 Tax=Lasiodiplodia mahajangana TaxID=1108764 RepID=A0ACC2JYI6_9PEZI|nr:hypothetical protein O1611_g1281 [Lasiodiplodia mahajangana]